MDGVLVVDKPAGVTSHDVVARIRRERGGRRAVKVGHAGTLDPFATGVLLVLLGRATRAQRFLMGLEKTYETVARFGAVSTTGDRDGEIAETGAPIPDPLVLPTGRIRQRPPAYSAVKVGGRRAYQLARAGEAVELAEREVEIHEAAELWREPPRVAIRLRCSSGTYVRSYVAGLGDAYCEQLRRTAIGSFSVDDADEERVVPLGDALARVLPVVRIDGDDARRAGHGVAIRAHPPTAGGSVLLVDAEGPIAVAEPLEGGLLKPAVGFRG